MTTETTFLTDVAKHQMTILHEDGLHRHIRFIKPDSSDMFFDLITWPGVLCYTGDMGTYIFRRLPDMFEFFRTDTKSPYLASKGLTLGINLSYWSEKLEAADRSDTGNGYQEFSSEKFTKIIREQCAQWVADCPKSDRRDLIEAVYDDVLAYAEDGEDRACRAAIDFSHETPTQEFNFSGFWEHNMHEYTDHFQWCCYALTWGIKQYEKSKTTESAAA